MALAEAEHHAALTAWHEKRKGARPASPVPALEAELRALEEDYTAFEALIEKALAEKTAWIAGHQDALVRDAAVAKSEAAANYLSAIDRLVEARETLLAARQDELYFALFPDSSVRSSAPTGMLVGGFVNRIRDVIPGLQVTFGVPALRRLLEADVEFAANVATPDQKHVLRERDPAADASADGAIWAESEEGQEQLRKERQEARERYFREWGRYPS